MYGASAALYGSPLAWAHVKGVDMRDTRNSETIRKTLELLGESENDCLWIPAIQFGDPLLKEPGKWVDSVLAKYGNAPH